jgi:hypothetical protein
VTVAVAAPLVLPKQLRFVCAVIATEKAGYTLNLI